MNQRTIMLVDDEQQILDTYRVILSGDEEDDDGLDELAAMVGLEEETDSASSREVFNLLEATQGEEALEKQRKAIDRGSPPAVALVDMRMPPGINGLETAIRLRHQDPAIYIIIITAYSDVESDTMQLALQHDFIFLKKPVIPEELYQIVRNAANAYQLSEGESGEKALDPPLYLDSMSQQQVLLVDDEPMMLKLAEAILVQYLNVKVITANTGKEALELAHKLSPDLILLDVKMSEMDGYTVCRALKSADETKEIPVIFLTAQSSDDQVVEGFQAGAVDYVAKPFSKPILIARVSTHLNLYRNSRRLKMLSNTDILTELPNRAAFQTYLEMRLRGAEEAKESSSRGEVPEDAQFALLFIDLDHFKPVNDELGHEVGDELLQAVAERLRHNVREVDLLSRIGGDEFVLMIGGHVTPQHVALVADNMVNLLCQPFKLQENTVQIGASIGSARFPADADDGETLLRNADIAMYEAKSKGRSCHVSFSSEFEHQLLERDRLSEELRIAIEQEQLKLLFQPKVELAGGRILGLDALLRWDHPERGEIAASEFIEVLMEGRLGEMSERSVLKMVCRQLKVWSEESGTTLPITINLSEERFKQRDLDQYIISIANEVELPLEMLSMIEVDLAEELLMKQPEAALKQLQKMIDIGLRITLDNFGSGRSSLYWLQQFPLNDVKLDRELIQKIGHTESDQLLRAALCMVMEMNYSAIAEGIESEVQLEFLKQHGCAAGLGYLLHSPMSSEDVLALLQKEMV